MESNEIPKTKSNTKLYTAAIIILIIAVIMLLWRPWDVGSKTDTNVKADTTSSAITTPPQPVMTAADSLKIQLAKQDSLAKADAKKNATLLAEKDQLIKDLAKRGTVKVVVECPPTSAPAAEKYNAGAGDMKKTVADLSSSPKLLSSEDPIPSKFPLPIFCVLTDQGFWPDYAHKYTEFPELLDNGKGGYNLKLTKYSEKIAGRYGFTFDGILFINVQELKDSNGKQLKGNLTSWTFQEMETLTNEDGTFYVWQYR